MNGKKILVRLNGLFLAINIILLILNLIVKSNEYKISNQRLENITQVLEKEGISIPSKLPTEYSPKRSAVLSFEGSNTKYTIEKNFFGNNMASVKHSVGESKIEKCSGKKMQYCTFNNEVLGFGDNYIYYENENVTDQGKQLSIEAAKKFCDTLIDRIYVGKREKFEIQYLVKDSYMEVVYHPLFDGIPVLGTSMVFKVCDSGVMSAEFYVGDITANATEKKDIYPVDLVLFGLKDRLKEGTKEQSPVVIKEVSLAYGTLSKGDDRWGQEIVPVYKIIIEGLENQVFVNAYTNEIIKCDEN